MRRAAALHAAACPPAGGSDGCITTQDCTAGAQTARQPGFLAAAKNARLHPGLGDSIGDELLEGNAWRHRLSGAQRGHHHMAVGAFVLLAGVIAIAALLGGMWINWTEDALLRRNFAASVPAVSFAAGQRYFPFRW